MALHIISPGDSHHLSSIGGSHSTQHAQPNATIKQLGKTGKEGGGGGKGKTEGGGTKMKIKNKNKKTGSHSEGMRTAEPTSWDLQVISSYR